MIRSGRQASLADYLAVFKRRKWLIIAVTVTAVSTAIIVSLRQSPSYAASATVLVVPNPLSPTGAGSAAADVQARYLSTQAQLAHTLKVAQPAAQASRIRGVTGDDLLARSTISPGSSTNILTFTVEDRKPAAAKSLANSFATEFTRFRTEQDNAAINEQLRSVSRQIASFTDQIRIAKAAGRPTADLHVKVNRLVRTQAALENLKLTQAGGASLASSARTATQTQPKPVRNALLAVAFGLLLGLVLAAIRDAFDSRVRSAEILSHSLDMPLLGRLETPPRRLRGERRVALLSEEDDVYSEGFRHLRLAFDHANTGLNVKTVLVTSAAEDEGKSTTAANLAVALGRTGRSVAIVDLDLRRPALHEFFDVPSRPGLTDVVKGSAGLEESLYLIDVADGHSEFPDSADQPRPRLAVLPCGSATSSVSTLLDSHQLPALLMELERRYDVIIIDSPPFLPVSDGVALGNLVGGILVIVRSSTVSSPALAELRRLLSVCRGAKLGYVLTGSETGDGYYGYGSYANTYQSSSPPDA